MVQKRRSFVQENDVDVVATQPRDEIGAEIRLVPVRRSRGHGAIDPDRHVDVAVLSSISTGDGPEHVCFADFGSPSDYLANARH